MCCSLFYFKMKKSTVHRVHHVRRALLDFLLGLLQLCIHCTVGSLLIMLHCTWILMGATHGLFPQLPDKKRAALTSSFLILLIQPAENIAKDGAALGPRLQAACINYSDTRQNWKWDITCFKIKDGCETKCHQVWDVTFTVTVFAEAKVRPCSSVTTSHDVLTACVSTAAVLHLLHGGGVGHTHTHGVVW